MRGLAGRGRYRKSETGQAGPRTDARLEPSRAGAGAGAGAAAIKCRGFLPHLALYRITLSIRAARVRGHAASASLDAGLVEAAADGGTG